MANSQLLFALGFLAATTSALRCSGADEVPILDAPARIAATCSKLQGAIPLEQADMGGWSVGNVARLGDGLAFLRWHDIWIEQESGGYLGDGSDLFLSSVDADVQLGAPLTVTHVADTYAPFWTTTSDDGVDILVRTSNFPSTYSLLSIDADGQVVAGPVPVPGLSDYDPVLFRRTEDGFFALCEGVLVRFDAAGAPLAPAAPLTEGVGVGIDDLIEVSGGYVGAWTYDGDVRVARFDPTGHPQRPYTFLDDGGDLGRRPAVVAFDGGFLVAYSDRGGYHSGATIVIQRLDADLSKSGPARRLQAAQDDVACHSPVWAPTVQGLGLAWSCGHVYQICSGCVANEYMGFAYLHADDLALASEPVEIHSTEGGGVFGRRVFEQEGDLVIAADISWHALSATAIATLHCEAAP